MIEGAKNNEVETSLPVGDVLLSFLAIIFPLSHFHVAIMLSITYEPILAIIPG